jgi:hypothetical protein
MTKEERDRSHSDDEDVGRRGRRKQDKTKHTAVGRSSLPAPNAKSLMRSTSDNVLLTTRDFATEPAPTQQKPSRERDSAVSQQSKRNSASSRSEAQGRNSYGPSTTARKSSQLDDRSSTADSIDDAVAEYIASPRLSHKIYHPITGRGISFSEVGDPDGSVVFCCVGMGTTRFLTAFYDELAFTLKLRLITPDRPGIGQSEAHGEGPDTPLAWPGKEGLFVAGGYRLLTSGQTTFAPSVNTSASRDFRCSHTLPERYTHSLPRFACPSTFVDESTSSHPGSPRPRW